MRSESEPESASGAAAERVLRKRKGRAVREMGDVEKVRRDVHDRAMGRYGIIVGGVQAEGTAPTYVPQHIKPKLSSTKIKLSDKLVIR